MGSPDSKSRDLKIADLLDKTFAKLPAGAAKPAVPVTSTYAPKRNALGITISIPEFPAPSAPPSPSAPPAPDSPIAPAPISPEPNFPEPTPAPPSAPAPPAPAADFPAVVFPAPRPETK